MQLRPALVATLALAACMAPTQRTILGGGDGDGTTTAQSGAPGQAAPAPPVIPGFDASRWIPAHPTYAFAAKNLADAQRAARGLLDTLGPAIQLDEQAASQRLQSTVGVDLLSADAAAAVGIDTSAGAAVFSEDLEPTMVMHLASPMRMAALLAVPRTQAESATVAGVDIYTVATQDVRFSWAIDNDWLWIHLGAAGGPPGASSTAWFEHARAGGGAALPTWSRTLHRSNPRVIAYADLHALAGALLAHAPGTIGQCAQRLSTVGGADGSFDFDERRFNARFAIDIGAGAAGLDAMLSPPPPGWAAASAGVPLAAQWNLDLNAASGWLAPCLPASSSGDLTELQGFGVRAARVAMQSFTDETTFAGVVSLDLANNKFIADKLDQIPLRKHIESDRTFGAYAGHHLAIPMMFAIDYVLTPSVALLARGDGLLERVTAPGPAQRPRVFSLDASPGAMSPGQWRAFVKLVNAPDALLQIVDWKTVHLAASVDGTDLVIEAAAEHR
jgi:hypothetical protein